MAPKQKDFLERRLYTYSPSRRVGHMKFRNNGLLLPFGHSLQSFDSPNPTLYRQHYVGPPNSATEVWPISDSSDPLDGWSMQDVNKVQMAAKNDIYGRLYNYLQDQFEQFAQKTKNMPLKFHLFNIHATDLPHYLSHYGLSRGTFDRIEVSI
jgi:hypothetical protein